METLKELASRSLSPAVRYRHNLKAQLLSEYKDLFISRGQTYTRNGPCCRLRALPPSVSF